MSGKEERACSGAVCVLADRLLSFHSTVCAFDGVMKF